MGERVYSGNAADDASLQRGWLLGHFVEGDQDLRRTTDLEVKWGVHPADERRREWTTGESRSTMLMLIEGRFRLELSTGTHVLAKRGDYVVWGPGVDHTWHAEETSVVLTVRSPSVPS